MEHIVEKLKSAAPAFAQKYNIDVMFLFGSYAVHREHPKSDVDIGIIGNVNFERQIELASDLAGLCHVARVDVVDMTKASPLLAHIATRSAIVLFEQAKGDFAEFRLSAFQRFVETRPLREMAFARTQQYIRETAL